MTSIKEIVDAHGLDHPRQRVIAIEASIRAICEAAGEDPADAVMVLLTAAAHISMQFSAVRPAELSNLMFVGLTNAIAMAEAWFGAEGQSQEVH